MDLHYVDYGLSKWKGKLCSTCLLFTNENISYIPVGRIIKTGGIESVIDYYKKIGESYYQELLDMLVFDAVILNEDRHFGNFGFLIDNKSNKIVGCAPIFDNGLSLLCYAMDDDFNTADALAAIFELVKFANTNVDENSSREFAGGLYEELFKLSDVLGLKIEKKEEILDKEIEDLIQERQAARKAKDFQRADEIRDELLKKGIILKDTREGVKWQRA